VAETVAALKTMGRGGAALKSEVMEDGWEEF
jgi:methyl-accepting chemotaxis protein